MADESATPRREALRARLARLDIGHLIEMAVPRRVRLRRSWERAVREAVYKLERDTETYENFQRAALDSKNVHSFADYLLVVADSQRMPWQRMSPRWQFWRRV